MEKTFLAIAFAALLPLSSCIPNEANQYVLAVNQHEGRQQPFRLFIGFRNNCAGVQGAGAIGGNGGVPAGNAGNGAPKSAGGCSLILPKQ